MISYLTNSQLGGHHRPHRQNAHYGNVPAPYRHLQSPNQPQQYPGSGGQQQLNMNPMMMNPALMNQMVGKGEGYHNIFLTPPLDNLVTIRSTRAPEGINSNSTWTL